MLEPFSIKNVLVHQSLKNVKHTVPSNSGLQAIISDRSSVSLDYLCIRQKGPFQQMRQSGKTMEDEMEKQYFVSSLYTLYPRISAHLLKKGRTTSQSQTVSWFRHTGESGFSEFKSR